MCGITGFWMARPGNAPTLAEAVRRMSGQLTHRGPDDAGEWVDPNVGVALGFRRLSIIDVSDQGHQPMVSQSGRFRIVFNGEVYVEFHFFAGRNVGEVVERDLELGIFLRKTTFNGRTGAPF